MKLVCVFLFLLLLSGLSSCASQADAFNHSLLALTWPPSFCHLKALNNTPCRETPIENFTIHGLWPANADGYSLNDTVQKNANLEWMKNNTLPLVKDLNRSWRSFNATFPTNQEFWRHEWNRHGCKQLEFKPKPYFQRALSVRNNISGSIVTALANQGVIPSNEKTYLLGNFTGVLRQVTGMDKVVLICVKGLLSEVRICVNRMATAFINCTENEMKISCTKPKLKFLPAPPASVHVREVYVSEIHEEL